MSSGAKPSAQGQQTSPRTTWCDNWYDLRPTYGGDVIAWPSFVASFTGRDGPKAHTHEIFDAWLELLPPKSAVRFARPDDTGRFFEYSDLTPEVVEQVRQALSPERISREPQWFQAYSDTEEGDCQRFSLEVFVSERSSYIYVTFPLNHVATRGVAAVVRWFSEWCARFEVTNGGAGFGYEFVAFQDWSLAVGAETLTTGLRYHGVRVWQRHHARFRGATLQSLDTAAWLTFLDRDSISAIGRRTLKQIDPGVLRQACGSGVLLQAGPEPDPCDSTRRNASYRLLKSVNDAIVAVRTPGWGANGWSGDVSYAALHGRPALYDMENSWFSRMDTETQRQPEGITPRREVALSSRVARLLATLAWLSLVPGVLFLDPELTSPGVVEKRHQQEMQFAKVVGELAKRPIASGMARKEDTETQASAARVAFERDQHALAVFVWVLVLLQITGWWLLYFVVLPRDLLAWFSKHEEQRPGVPDEKKQTETPVVAG